MDYILRNGEILRSYMVHLIDEDVKSRGPLNRALKEGEPRAIEAARQPASAIPAEIVNMMGKLLPLAKSFHTITPDSPRALSAEDLAAFLRGKGAEATPCRSVEEGLELLFDFVKIVVKRNIVVELFDKLVGDDGGEDDRTADPGVPAGLLPGRHPACH